MKKGFITAALILTSVFAMAQQKENRDENGKILRGPYLTNKFFDNMFIGIGGGVNVYQGELDNEAGLGKRLAPALDLSIGKWFTPYSGVRLQYTGLQAKGYTQPGAIFANGTDGSFTKKKMNVLNLHADYLWNLSNAFLGYNEKRVWNFIPYAGFGWMRSSGNGNSENEIGGTFGVLNTFRLGKVVDLTLEARQSIVNQRFDGVIGGSKLEGISSVTLGLSFKLGKTRFDRLPKIEPADYTPYNNRINELRAQNEKLQADNKQLADELAALKNRKVEATKEVVSAPLALFFTIGKAKLDSKGLTNLDYYANSVMKADNKTYTLTGSADRVTGTKAFNQKLSEKRVDHVYNILVEKYGISADRLVKKAEGDTNNRFKEAVLNRVVIVE